MQRTACGSFGQGVLRVEIDLETQPGTAQHDDDAVTIGREVHSPRVEPHTCMSFVLLQNPQSPQWTGLGLRAHGGRVIRCRKDDCVQKTRAAAQASAAAPGSSQAGSEAGGRTGPQPRPDSLPHRR